MGHYLFLVTLMALGLFLNSCSGFGSKGIRSIHDVVSAMEPKDSVYQIDPSKENVIEGAEGTSIYIPSNALILEDGSAPQGSVKVVLKEYYSASSIMAANLSTRSGSRLLETGGMLNITASYRGETLAIKDGQSVFVAFPKKVASDSMSLFYGVSDGDGNVDWMIDYEYELQPENTSNGQETTGEPLNSLDDNLDLRWTYRLDIGLRSKPLIDHPLVGSALTIEEYVRKNQYLSDSTIKSMVENGDQRCAIHFKITKDGKIYDIGITRSATPFIDEKTIEFFENFPQLDLEKSGILNVEHYRWSLGVRGELVYDKEGYIQRFREKYAAQRAGAFVKMEKSDLDNYIFNASNLGWINCDRFIDYDGQKVDYYVKVKDPLNSRVQVVFTDMNSLMSGTLIDGHFVFSGLPVNAKVKVIAINFSNGKPFLAKAFTKVDSTVFEPTDFKPFTMGELDKEIKAQNF